MDQSRPLREILTQAIARAGQAGRPSRWKTLFRRQAPVNRLLLEALEGVAQRLENQNTLLCQVATATGLNVNDGSANREQAQALARQLTTLPALAPAIAALDQRLAAQQLETAELHERFIALRTELIPALAQLRTTISTIERNAATTREMEDCRRGLRAQLEQLHNVEKQLAHLQHRADELAIDMGDAPHFEQRHGALFPQLASGEATNRGSFDTFYRRFEDAFRGSRDEVRRKMEIYLPRLLAVAEETGLPRGQLRCIDLGCGRGEWLELLRSHGFTDVTGCERNSVMAQPARDLGLTVEDQDLFAYIRALPAGSVHVVSAFHVIEHLPALRRLEFYREVHRVLAPQGLALFETPNPENVSVGSCNFYFDITHLRPLVPAAEQFSLRQIGFGTVDIERCNPLEADFMAPTSNGPKVDHLARFFSGPQDFALISRK